MRWIICSLVFLFFSTMSRAGELTLNQSLIAACYQLNVDEVVSTLRQGASVNARFGDSAYDCPLFRDRWTGASTPVGAGEWTPLQGLAAAPQLPDPPLNIVDIWKYPDRVKALQKAIPPEQIRRRQQARVIIAHILLSHGCALNAEDGYGATSLYTAVVDGDVNFVRILLNAGANPNTRTGVYIDGPSDTTPLHYASSSIELFQLLLKHGANPLVKDSKGNTPIDWVEMSIDRTFDVIQTKDGWLTQPRTP
ncbi:MAG: ankyrin repeat domain-containing protein [Planctomycetaceae bacterium]